MKRSDFVLKRKRTKNLKDCGLPIRYWDSNFFIKYNILIKDENYYSPSGMKSSPLFIKTNLGYFNCIYKDELNAFIIGNRITNKTLEEIEVLYWLSKEE